MSEINTNELQRKIDTIVKEYLFNISSLRNHDYFTPRKAADSRAKYYRSSGFGIISKGNENNYVVEEEQFLEGCTRVFLINPIFRMLMGEHDIENDWQFGNTFSNYTISNREYELGSFIEFAAIINGKNFGVRYTRASYKAEETFAQDRDSKYLFEGEKIPGFDKISRIDKVYALDWSGISEDELAKIYPVLPGEKRLTENMSVERFFATCFSLTEYEIVIAGAKDAIEKAKEIIALKATPQLLPNNMLNFKQAILNDFKEERMDTLEYIFEVESLPSTLSDADVNRIKEAFFTNHYMDALIGDADFAKSFITSEYLFKTIKSGLSIDYTAVVVGYLKSVEQMLYLLYISAFEGASKMNYWDRCNKTDKFDINDSSRYRFDPYNLEKGWKQEMYSHRKKIGDNSPEIGELTRFLRYFEKMWSVSKSGKEYIFKCLEDFRGSCRNSHFHKDNIYSINYATVERIRNNTHLCLYYLLGGFKLLDCENEKRKQLGILDYRFENLFREIRQKRRRYFSAKFSDDSEVVICYLNDDLNTTFNESGVLTKAELRFVNTGMSREKVTISELNQLVDDSEYIERHTIYITRNTMPVSIVAFIPQKKT